MNFIMKLKTATWIMAAFFISVAPSAWADCPTHATYPTEASPGVPPPPNCKPDGDTNEPPVKSEEASISCPPVCPVEQQSPDSLPTVGEQVRLHVTGGGGAVPMRWGKTICFGDGFRLNYLSYFQFTAEGLYARLYDPAGQAVHNFRTDPDAATTRTETIVIDGESYTVRQYSDCYRGEMPAMNRVTLKTYTPVNADHPARMELIYPEGGMLHYEFDSYEPVVGDLAGPLYRVSRRVTREGHAVTFTYHGDRLVIRDASGHEYVCFLDADRHIVKIAVNSEGESRTWSYVHRSGKLIETNDQTGVEKQMNAGNYVTHMYVTPPAGTPGYGSTTFTRDAKGNLTYMNENGDSRSYAITTLPSGNTRHVETRDGRKITREYDANGLVSQENSLGGREEFLYDEAKRMTYHKDALGNEWHYEYSAPGQISVLLRQTAPDGGETRYEYVPGTDLVSTKRVKLDDETWRVVSYAYDAKGRLIEETRQLEDGKAAITRHLRRDDGSIEYTLVKVDDARWTATRYEHNAAGQLAQVKGPYYIEDPANPWMGLPAAGRSYAYDAWGNTVSETDELGNATLHEYDGGNRRVATINPLGHRTEYAYDGFGRRVSQTDALGNRTGWTYNAADKVTSVTGSAGVAGCGGCALAAGTADRPGTYTWSSGGLLTSFKDLEGRTTTYEYDAARRKSKETDPLGNATLFGYDAAGRLASVTDPMGNVTRYAYDAVGRRISTTDPLGNVSGVEYDLAGRVVRIYDAAGGERMMEYGADGRLLGTKTKVDESTWRETRYAHNLRGDLMERVDAFGTPDAVVTRHEYTAQGLPSKVVIDPAGLNIAVETVYNDAGKVVQNIDGNGNATLIAYDAAGNLVSETSPEGRVIAHVYDEIGRRTETVLDPDGIAQGQYTAYDVAGRVADESDGVAAQSYAYDKVGRLTKIIIPGQQDVNMIYDSAGRLTETNRLNASGKIAISVRYAYDQVGRTTKATDEAGKITQYEYDAAGRLVKTVDPLGAETQYEYDSAGRRNKVILPHGGERMSIYNLAGELVRSEGGAEGTVQYHYDAMGRPVETIDANGRSRKTFYDLVGRIVRIENEMAQPVTYTYDKAGNRLSLSDANSNTTTFEYDRDGKLLVMTYPPVSGESENIERYQYDAAGRSACKTTPNGDDIRYLYDPAGNVAALYHGAVVADIDSIPADRLLAKYERNGVGAVTKEEDSLTAMLYSFDSYGRLTEARDRSLEKAVRYAYDTRSLRSKMEVVDYASSQNGNVSITVTYNYDDTGRLQTVRKDSDPAAVYTYDLSGRRIGLILPNGVATEYTYDSADRLVKLLTQKDEIVLAKFAYTLDPTGNRTGITYADESRSLYEFDQAYRLTREKHIGAGDTVRFDESYTYDAAGNRLTKVRTGWNPVNVYYQHNGRNQLVLTSGSETKKYGYDANGNMINITADAYSESMNYDILNRLIRYGGPAGTEGTTYRGIRWNRWKVATAADTVVFLYDNNNIVGDFAENGNLEKLYVTSGIDEYISMSMNTDTYYYILDANKMFCLLTNEAGEATDRQVYTAFGERHSLDIDNALVQRYGYHGREQTAEGMFFRYRRYSPPNGIFLSRDPLAYEANPHGDLYRFVLNNPIHYKDAFGLLTEQECEEKRADFKMNKVLDFYYFLKGKNCRNLPFPIFTCDCCQEFPEASAIWNRDDGFIRICSDNVNFDDPESVYTSMRHEIVHYYQDMCLKWPPPGPDDCDRRACREIMAYTLQGPFPTEKDKFDLFMITMFGSIEWTDRDGIIHCPAAGEGRESFTRMWNRCDKSAEWKKFEQQ